MRMLWDNEIDKYTLIFNSETSFYPVENAQDYQLAKKYRTTGDTDEWVKIDAGAGNTITATCAAILGHNLTEPEPGINWTQKTSPFATSYIRFVAHNGSDLWVAVGQSGKLATSSNGIDWTQRTSSFDTTVIRGVAHNGSNLWVAVGDTGKLATSSNGIDWAQVGDSTFGATDISSVAHNGSNLWVAVGKSGKLATSPDGTNWTQRTSSFDTTDIWSVAYNDSNLWVAGGSSGKLATSPDGENWTQRTSSFDTSYIWGVAHNGSNLWVAVGGNGKLATSPDGTTWTQKTNPFGTTYIETVAHNQSSLWVAAGEQGKLATSPDGETWTPRTSSFGSTYIYGIAYNGSDSWVAVAYDGKLATSSYRVYKIQGNASDAWSDPTVNEYFAYNADIMIDYFSSNALRFWRFHFADDANPDTYLEIGRLFLGTYLETDTVAKAFSLTYEDTSTVTESLTGQSFGDERVIQKIYNFNFPYWTDTVRKSIITMLETIKIVKPIILIPDENNVTKVIPVYCRLNENMYIDHIVQYVWDGNLSFKQVY